MMKQVLIYVINGWCSPDAGWTQVFCSLVAFGAVFFLLSFLACGWMLFVY